jgi:hypothetical protein
MEYDSILDKWQEECGVFGIYDKTVPVSTYIYEGLLALQHRGQESCGIVVADANGFNCHKGMGLVRDVLSRDMFASAGNQEERGGHVNHADYTGHVVYAGHTGHSDHVDHAGHSDHSGHAGIGHVRYSTSGGNNAQNIQPLVMDSKFGPIALAHNGTITNGQDLRKKLEREGVQFQTTMDSEVLIQWLARSHCSTMVEALQGMAQHIIGAYSLVILTTSELLAVRDPFGYRPLCIGRTPRGFVVASESCAIDAVQGSFIRDVKPGEIICIGEEGLRDSAYATAEKGRSKDDETIEKGLTKDEETINRDVQIGRSPHTCVFEYIYFASPHSVIDGQPVGEARFEMGRQLARETRYEADLVMPIPSSGTLGAKGYAQESGIPYVEGLRRRPKVGRTFIRPTQDERERGVRQKFEVLPEVVRGKRVILIDDSIVRGTTSKIIVHMLRQAGATEVSLCLTSEPVRYPCYYGIDTSRKEELLAHQLSVDDIRRYIQADRLYFLSPRGWKQSLLHVQSHLLCRACFDGTYTSPIPEE